jgi:16S rRNA (cytosine1402-N4)-methyltransferase
LHLAGERLADFGPRAVLRQASFADMGRVASELGWSQVDGVLLDLGLSSMQLDDPERGFTFRADGPLDMRFDPGQGRSAADWINQASREELADLIFRYGEERASRRIAAAIVAARPISGTIELAQLIQQALGGGRGRIHPATRSFQALRIAVNDELGELERGLPVALDLLAPASRLAVIAFHSLEDRIVKQFMAHESRDCICPPEQPICTCEHKARLKMLTRKPIRPDEMEVARNLRARSARLRIAERTSSG